MNALAQLDQMNAGGDIPEPSRAHRPERKRRKDHQRRGEYEVVDVEHESPRRESRRTYEDRHADRDRYASPRRSRHHDVYSESEREPETPRRVRRQHAYLESDFDDEEGYRSLERERRRRRRKKKRIVSGAIVEEGRATPEIRGGVGSKHSSYNSIEQEKFAHYNTPGIDKKKRKKCSSK